MKDSNNETDNKILKSLILQKEIKKKSFVVVSCFAKTFQYCIKFGIFLFFAKILESLAKLLIIYIKFYTEFKQKQQKNKINQ